jgi:hypothetical protein
MQNTARRQIWTDTPVARFSLGDVARKLDVPIVIATFSDASSVRNHSTYGLDFGMNWAEFAAAIDLLFLPGAGFVPNVEVHPTLAKWAASLVAKDIRFLAGTPLCDFDGWRIGSIAVLANQKHVARKGIAMRELATLGREFVGVAR